MRVKSGLTLARITGTLLMTAFLVLTLVIAVQGAFQTRSSIAETFSRQSQIQAAQIALEELLRYQIEEENLLRGYALTHDSFYVDQYRGVVGQFDEKEAAIRDTLQAPGLKSPQLSEALGLLDQYAKLQATWRDEVASAVISRPDVKLTAVNTSNKLLSDQETATVGRVRKLLAETNSELARSTQAQLDRTSYVRAFWLLLFGLLAILFNAYRMRVNRELEEERTTTETLQRAFQSEKIPLPGCDVGSAYLSASRHLAVGGDVFDVYRLSDSLALLLIADVSGKGVDAAVLTAFIKFTIRGIALRHRDPGTILAEFNRAFAQAVENPYLFVSMFVGLLDTENFKLLYGSAGHDSAFLRRSSGEVQQLAVTGPVLGVMEEPFGTRLVNLETGDILVLATDGLTEARDRQGRQLLETGAMHLIEMATPDAQALAEELVAQVRAVGRNYLRDDLAILTIKVLDEGAHGDA